MTLTKFNHSPLSFRDKYNHCNARLKHDQAHFMETLCFILLFNKMIEVTFKFIKNLNIITQMLESTFS